MLVIGRQCALLGCALLGCFLVGALWGGVAVAAEPVLPVVNAALERFVESGDISGAVTLVVRDGEIVHLGAVGEADLAAGRPMEADALFAIASMTKPITATALMILVDQGAVSLEDPVSRYVPEFADVRLRDADVERPLTLRDLLTHTSGLVGSQQNEGTLAETAQKLAERPLGFQPGSRWSYSPGLTAIGRVVEVVSEQPYEEFLAERIFEPLGMRDTTFNPSPEQQQRIPVLYQPSKQEGQKLQPTEHWLSRVSEIRTPNPSGGLFSTAADLARFYEMILAGGELDGKRIVSAEAIQQMRTIQTADLVTGFTPGNGWGLGWCVVREPQGVSGMLSPGTFGHGGAFGTQAWLDPQTGTAYVLLIQRVGLPNADASDIRKEFQQAAVEALGL